MSAGMTSGEFAVDLVAGADGNLGALVHHVHLGDDEPLGPVDHVGVAEERQVEPAAAARTSGDGTVLLATGAEQIGGVVMDLGGEGALRRRG